MCKANALDNLCVPSLSSVMFRQLGNGGVSNCFFGVVSGDNVVLGKSHETVTNRKGFSPNTYNALSARDCGRGSNETGCVWS